jgi:dienelactone hydrolase
MHKFTVMKKYIVLLTLVISVHIMAQKKPLDHSVYDGWQSIGERMISNNGEWVVYTINLQEGDNELVIQSADASYKKTIARGYNAKFTEDSRFVIFKIRPLFKDTREARVKKKRPDDFPKDSIAIIELGKDSVWKRARIKNFTNPEKSFGWVVYHMEKPLADSARSRRPEPNNNKIVDSLKKLIDSLRHINEQLLAERKSTKDLDDFYFADEDPAPATDAGTDLVLRKLGSNEEKTFKNVLNYAIDKKGKKLLLSVARNARDSLSKNTVVLYDVQKNKADTLSRGGNDFKNFVFDDDGEQLAWIAERDSSAKALQKFYKLWYYKAGMDSATMIVAKNSAGIKPGMTISEFATPDFSKSGKRLFFGTALIQAPKDTTVPDIDKVSVDIWNHKDDYLQTVQLNRLQTDLRRSYLAVFDVANHSIQQLETEELPTVYQTHDGDGNNFVGVTDFGRRIEGQWKGRTNKDIYAINPHTGTKKLVIQNGEVITSPQWVSPTGKFIIWYDYKLRNYFVHDGNSTRNITAKIRTALWNEESEVPDSPNPYGVMGWYEGDSAVYVYDRYDIWKIDLSKNDLASSITNQTGRKDHNSYRYVSFDPEKRFFSNRDQLMFRRFDDDNKEVGLSQLILSENPRWYDLAQSKFSIGQITPCKGVKGSFIYTKENYQASPDIYSAMAIPVMTPTDPVTVTKYSFADKKLSSINPQQANYNWGTAELFKWKAYNGKESEGIVYKPEDFDPKKKYPMICYFYETLSDGLFQYQAPSPTPSRLNIPFFVSRGYVVFAPDIHYGTGHPARDCYNHVVSGARALVKQGYVDSTKIGIQGQSWGGIQVAQLITMTNLFKAAWAGAPVANMTSAYGGIRWESGVTRQFQYERGQSRIGKTLWEKPALYIENSPIFHVPKVNTPLVIMANDADGAVPWWQGIELFTAMRRLGKQVWMLNYNGEAHNLVERKNRKDIQIREQQYFDWLLKGDKPPKWITNGVPAVKKGRDWGLEIAE